LARTPIIWKWTTKACSGFGDASENEGDAALPNFKALGDRKLDAILLSHAHQDHIGTLPVLMRRQPDARVFMTDAAGEIGSILLHNSVNVMTRQREEIGATLYPLFTHREAERAFDQWHFCPMRQRITISGERARPQDQDVVTFEFFDAGHVLGSTGIMLRSRTQTIFYTGDVQFDDQTIMQAADFPEEKIDIMIMECTRGDHATPAGWTRAGEERRLAEAITEAFRRGGCVLIPVFALGKTQEFLAMIHQFRRENLLGDFPIYIGGLSSKMTIPMTPRLHDTASTAAFATHAGSSAVYPEWSGPSAMRRHEPGAFTRSPAA
jgi:Cft2 family RNA processing exonuclease